MGAAIARRATRPAEALALLLAGYAAIAASHLPANLSGSLRHLCVVLLICASAVLLARVLYVLDDLLITGPKLKSENNLKARQLYTEVQILRRAATLLIALVALSAILLTFPAVQAAGAGLLASAGLVGLVAGVAARPTAANLMAGIQIALSQPIRVDDVVVVEGQWGRVEEITLTMVVVRVWDLRRLVLPIVYFVQNPFENWTRATANILGWVFLEVDFTADVAVLRAHLEEVVRQAPDWDGKVAVLQVTNSGPDSMQLRALFSSSDSSRSWNLQCEVRERMVDFMRTSHPDWLPRHRIGSAPGQVELLWGRAEVGSTGERDGPRTLSGAARRRGKPAG